MFIRINITGINTPEIAAVIPRFTIGGRSQEVIDVSEQQ